MTETFHEEDTVKLSEEDIKEVHRIREDLELRGRDPAAYYAMLAKRSQVANAQVLARHPQFANVSGAGQAAASMTPTPQGNVALHSHFNYEDWRLARQALVNAVPPKMTAEHSSIPGAPESAQMIGPVSFFPIQDRHSTAISNVAGHATSDLRALENPPNVLGGQKPHRISLQSNSPQVLTDNTATVNAQIGEQNSASEETCRANMMDLDAGSNSTVISIAKSTAKEQSAGTPNHTGTPMSGKPQKLITPPKTARTTPGTPSRASSGGPVTSEHSATTLLTNDARRVLRSSSQVSSLSGRESKQKRSSTPSTREPSTSFRSGFGSLNDAFRSGSAAHHTT